MLMHSCYCVFISVTGGFVQMLKDLKNLLKLSLKILFIKRKRKISFHFLPSSDSARWLFFFSLAQLPPAAQRLPPAQPRAPRRPSYARPSNCRAQPSSRAPRRRPHQATAAPSR